MGADMSINDFVQELRKMDPTCEYRAVKDGQAFKSVGWKKRFEDGDKKAFTPATAPREAKNDPTRRR